LARRCSNIKATIETKQANKKVARRIIDILRSTDRITAQKRDCGDTKEPAQTQEGTKMGMSLHELTQAIRQHIDAEMEADVASGMAEHALGFFGFYERIIDNALEPTDRNLFYMFQDYNLLTTESEETTLWDGREWRIHYWRFKPELREKVQSYMDRNKPETEVDPFGDVYGGVGDVVWNRDDDQPANPNAFTNERW
jgi:hypothetical protein